MSDELSLAGRVKGKLKKKALGSTLQKVSVRGRVEEDPGGGAKGGEGI